MELVFVKQIPPGDPPHRIEYEVEDDVLTVKYTRDGQEVVEEFDFNGVPDGVLELETIESELPIVPLLSVEKVDGQLTATVLDWSMDDGEVPVE